MENKLIPEDALIDTLTGQGLIFVVGCPRSGTTWIQRMLSAHPRIETGQESFLFNRYISPSMTAWRTHLETTEKKRGGLGLPTYMDAAQFREMMAAHLARLLDTMIAEVRPGVLFLEKTPDHGLVLQDICTLLPRAKIVNVTRSPRAVASSVMKTSASWGADWAPSSPVGAIRFWRRHVDAARNAAPSVAEDQFLDLRYEDVRADTHAAMRDVFTFLGLPFDMDLIEEIVTANSLERSRRGEGTVIPIRGEIAARTGRAEVFDPASFVGAASLNAWGANVSWPKRMLGEAYMRYAIRKSGHSADLIRSYL